MLPRPGWACWILSSGSPRVATKDPPDHLLLNTYYMPGPVRCPRCLPRNFSSPERWVFIKPTLQMNILRLREANLHL